MYGLVLWVKGREEAIYLVAVWYISESFFSIAVFFTLSWLSKLLQYIYGMGSGVTLRKTKHAAACQAKFKLHTILTIGYISEPHSTYVALFHGASSGVVD